MKKALAFILALVLVLSVFAGVTAFAGEDISSYHMEFDIDGYCCGKLAENVTVKDNTWSFAFDGYKAHIEADGETVEGFLKSGVDYDLVIKMKVIPCFGMYYNFLDIPKKNISVVGLEAFVRATDTTAYEYYEDGEYYVAKFKLPVLELKYETYDFTLNGYSLGADVDKIEVTGADWIEIPRAILKVREGDRLNYTDGCITSGAEYYLQIMFIVPDGVSCYNVPNETILLHGVGEKAIPCTGVLTFGKTSYMTNFPLPAPEEKPDEKLSCDMDGDGVITVTDALILLREAAHLTPAPKAKSVGPRKGDMDGDGIITVTDALMLLRIAAKLA